MLVCLVCVSFKTARAARTEGVVSALETLTHPAATSLERSGQQYGGGGGDDDYDWNGDLQYWISKDMGGDGNHRCGTHSLTHPAATSLERSDQQ